jgi:hypothetical protein
MEAMNVQQSVSRIRSQLDQKCEELVEQIALRNFEKAAKTAIAHIKYCSRYRQSSQIGEVKSICTMSVILFNGLRDLANLLAIKTVQDWYCKRGATELAWELAHDAEERLNRCGFRLEESFTNFVHSQLEHVKKIVRHRYGEGLFVSPEIASDSVICTVCEDDFRTCDHLPGHFYDGKKCQLRPFGNLTVLRVSIVANPTDPRCRLWPWNKGPEEDDHFSLVNVRLMGAFSLEGDDDLEHIVDLVELSAEPHFTPDNVNDSSAA